MHKETLDKLTNAAINKINLLNTSKVKYLVSSAFAGLYVFRSRFTEKKSRKNGKLRGLFARLQQE